MAISTTFTWNIESCKREVSDGFIIEAQATLTGVAKSDSVGIATYGYNRTVGFGTVRPDPMIAYASVTEANVISWVETELGSSEINSLKDNINIGLVNLWNPAAPTEANGVPW